MKGLTHYQRTKISFLEKREEVYRFRMEDIRTEMILASDFLLIHCRFQNLCKVTTYFANGKKKRLLFYSEVLPF